MADLHPDVRALRLRRRAPGAQRGKVLWRLFAFNGDIARPLQIHPVDQHIPRQQQAAAAARPCPVERLMAFIRAVVRPGQMLGHRRLAEAVRQTRAAWQVKWLLKYAGHDKALPLEKPPAWRGGPAPSTPFLAPAFIRAYFEARII